MNMLAALAGIGGHVRQLAKLAYFAAAWALEICPVAEPEKVLQASVIVREHPHKILYCQRLSHSYLPFLGRI